VKQKVLHHEIMKRMFDSNTITTDDEITLRDLEPEKCQDEPTCVCNSRYPNFATLLCSDPDMAQRVMS
jgi:hypothetical protein